MKFYCITRFVQCFSPSVDQILRYSILTTKITRLNTCFCIVPLTWESFNKSMALNQRKSETELGNNSAESADTIEDSKV